MMRCGGDTVRAITIRPGPAQDLLAGRKRIENRAWGRHVRGEIALHVSQPDGHVRAVIAVLDVVTPEEALRRYPDQRDYISGPLCWVIRLVRLVPPVRARGRLNLWQWPGDGETPPAPTARE